MQRNDSYLDLQAVARRLRLRLDTVLQLVHANAIRGRLVSGRWWVKRSEIARFQRRQIPRAA